MARCVQLWTIGSEAIWAAALSADGRRLLTGDGNGRVSVWDVESGEKTHVLAEPDASAPVLARDLQERLEAASELDRETTGRFDACLLELYRDYAAHPAILELADDGDAPPRDKTARVVAAVSGDGRFGAAATAEGRFDLWDLDTGRRVESLTTGPLDQLILDERGSHALGNSARGVEWWDLERHERLWVAEPLNDFLSLGLTGHGRAVMSGPKRLDVRELATGRRLEEHRFAESVWASADGRHALSGAFGGGVRLWDVDAERELAFFPRELPGPFCVSGGMLFVARKGRVSISRLDPPGACGEFAAPGRISALLPSPSGVSVVALDRGSLSVWAVPGEGGTTACAPVEASARRTLDGRLQDAYDAAVCSRVDETREALDRAQEDYPEHEPFIALLRARWLMPRLPPPPLPDAPPAGIEPHEQAWIDGWRAAQKSLLQRRACELTIGLPRSFLGACPRCLLRTLKSMQQQRCSRCRERLLPLKSTGCVLVEGGGAYVAGYNAAVAAHVRMHINPDFRWEDVREDEGRPHSRDGASAKSK